MSVKKVASERDVRRVDDNTIEVSMYFEIAPASIADVGTISYSDACAQNTDSHKKCRVHVLPTKEIMDWARQRRTSKAP